ncbi:MAG: PQQ-binding-like beta-propeller repeat protein [Deinococcus-Thermus bacterium]|jgi:outer membrane protein assembly factor BamB|nr:PQQ-binding-like beta-propeller repeat protein [Deinococcota bacterium]
MTDATRSGGARKGARRRPAAWAALLAVAAATGCSDEVILEGQRFDVRTPLEATAPGEDGAIDLAAAAPVGANRAAPIDLPPVVNHAEWTHRYGTPAHRIAHPALGRGLSQVWSARIGQGDGRRAAITADPVVAGGRIFTLDSASRAMAHATDGAPLWSRALVPASDRAADATGGGLAFGDGRLFVTTGFGELHALDPESGAVLWTQDFDAPVDGAPTVSGDLVYVTSRDNRAFAVRTDNGRLQWQLPGAPTPSSTLGGAGPAVTDRLAIFPFGSAELVATLKRGGVRVWSATIAGERTGRAYAGFSDITGDPVVAGDVIYAGSPAGRIAALDARSGERIWTAREGAMSPVWPVGGSVFAVTDIGQLVRLDAADGSVIWAIDLPFYQNTRVRRRQGVWDHYGPVLAGGRLLVASDDGAIRSFDPVDGRLLSTTAIRGGATTNPVVVNGTLYLVSGDGRLTAYR